MIAENVFYYGTNYWRPPNPPREQHRFHLEKIKHELGFDTVNLRIMWNWHHRQKGEFCFGEVNEIFDICEEIDLNVMLQLNLETAPYWLEQLYPRARYVSANGRSIELGAQEAVPTGGHPGLCFHNEAVQVQAEQYMRRMAREFRHRKRLYAIDAWNEPHLEPAWCNNMWGNAGDKLFCYCRASRAAFRNWLENRYGEIDRFNAAWGRAYSCFEHIEPPILQGNYADWLDWMRFWFDELQQNLQWRVRALKQEAPGLTVASHSGAVPPVLPRANAMIHNWKFAEAVDMWGTSFAPQAFSWDLATCAQVIELTRSASRGKDFWVSEMPGGPANIRVFRASRVPRHKDYQTWNWLAAALGSRGTLHWCYLAERTGQEAPRFGMIRADGKHTPRSRAIAKAAALLKEHADVITNANIPTQVAILYDPDNSSLLFAMELEDKLYGESHTGYYRAIWKSDLTAKYITYETFEDLREKVLIVPMALTMPEKVADNIAEFVYGGGVLVCDTMTGMFDERGWYRAQIPPGKLATAAGLIEGESVCSDPQNDISVPAADGSIDSSNRTDLPPLEAIHRGPPIRFSWPTEVCVPAHGYLTPLELAGAEAIGTYDRTYEDEGIVLATHHAYGQGEVYYFGTFLGLALNKGLAEAHLLLKTILQQHVRPVISADRLRPRLIASAGDGLLAVFNDDRTERVEEQIMVPDRYRKALDIYSNRELQVINGRCTLDVEAEGVRVIRLSS